MEIPVESSNGRQGTGQRALESHEEGKARPGLRWEEMNIVLGKMGLDECHLR